MTDIDRDSYALRDEDRLPWLEAVDDEEDVDRVSPLRLAALLLIGLALLGAIIAGVWWWQSRDVTPTGEGELIAAPPGPYKVKPDDPGGMQVEGKGDAAFATSEGAAPTGALDLGALPEDPVARTAPAPKPAQPAPAAQGATAKVQEGGQLVAKAPPVQPEAPAGPAGSVVQLGAFDSQAIANSAWTSLSGRFGYLEGLTKIVVPAKVGGRTFYRLRAATSSADQARDVCARLKVAGENCLVVN